MPEIPTFVSTQSYQGAGGGQPSTISPNLPMQDGSVDFLAGVSKYFGDIADRLNEQQAASDAIKISTEGQLKLADLKVQLSNDPEPLTAPSRFMAAKDDLQKELLSRTTNPRVRALVDTAFQQHMASTYVSIAQTSYKRAHEQQAQSFLSTLGEQGKLLAATNNAGEEESTFQLMRKNVARGVASGFIAPGLAGKVLSDTLRDVITIKSATDPSGAARIFETYKNELTIDDQAKVAKSLHGVMDKGMVASVVDQASSNIPSSAVSSNNKAQAAYEYFRAKGYSPAGAAAVVANTHVETGGTFDPTLSHDGGIGIGILGWNKDRRTALEAKYGKNPSFEQQLEFLDFELRGGGDPQMGQIGQSIIGATDAAKAGADLSSIGVRPKDVEGNRRARGELAIKYERQFNPPVFEATHDGPPATGVLPNVIGVPTLQQRLDRVEVMTNGWRPELKEQALKATVARWERDWKAATGDLSQQLDLQEKLDKAAAADLKRKQSETFSGFMGRIQANEVIPPSELTGAVASQSITQSQYDFITKVGASQQDGRDNPQAVLDIGTQLMFTDQADAIVNAANEGRLSKTTALDLMRRNQSAREKPFKNTEEEEGFKQVTTLLSGPPGALNFSEKMDPAKTRVIVQAQQEYLDRIRAGEAPRAVVTDIAGRYVDPISSADQLPIPRFGPRPNDKEQVVEQGKSLKERYEAGQIKQADYEREMRLLGQYRDIFKTVAPPPKPKAAPQGGLLNRFGIR